MNLSDFLLARLAEDEAAALAAVSADRPGTHWCWNKDGDGSPPVYTLRTVEEFPTTSGVGDLPAFPIGYEPQIEETRALAHIATYDPARVLAQVAATRAIVGACRPDYEESLASNDDTTSLAEEVLRLLAAPYASHPDWREEWSV